MFSYNTSVMKNKFMLCGTVGWCMEIIFTALHSFRNKEFKLIGQTSVWMFPIYGLACFLAPVSRLLKNKNTFIRGGIYTLCIFTGEFFTGALLKKYNLCPWDYSKAKLNIKGLIRLDYAPFWFGAGLLYEKILK